MTLFKTESNQGCTTARLCKCKVAGNISSYKSNPKQGEFWRGKERMYGSK